MTRQVWDASGHRLKEGTFYVHKDSAKSLTIFYLRSFDRSTGTIIGENTKGHEVKIYLDSFGVYLPIDQNEFIEIADWMREILKRDTGSELESSAQSQPKFRGSSHYYTTEHIN